MKPYVVGLFFSHYKAIKTTFTCSACGDGGFFQLLHIWLSDISHVVVGYHFLCSCILFYFL